MSIDGQYWGKFQATVTQNIDPKHMGRLLVSVPDVLSFIPSTWAQPCVPLAGPTGPPMGVYMVPPIGTPIWVEFEHGNASKPIWVGCRWGQSAAVPLATQTGNPADPPIVFQTLLQQAIIISDMAPSVPAPVMPPTPTTGGIILRSTTGASIVVNDAGVFISNGKGATIQLLGKSVMINQTALVVT